MRKKLSHILFMIFIITITSCNKFKIERVSKKQAVYPKYSTNRLDVEKEINKITYAKIIDVGSVLHKEKNLTTNELIVSLINPKIDFSLDKLIKEKSILIRKVIAKSIVNSSEFDKISIAYKKEYIENGIWKTSIRKIEKLN